MVTQTFRSVRTAAVKAGVRALALRQLRHPCIVQPARAEYTIPEIASIAGHGLGSMTTILTKYLPRVSTVARTLNASGVSSPQKNKSAWKRTWTPMGRLGPEMP